MVSPKILCLASAALGATAIPTKASKSNADPIIFNFPCTRSDLDSTVVDMPDVCKNMCFGLNCMKFTANLYHDKKATLKTPIGQDTARSRLETAGCGTGNRCGKGEYERWNYECDEFPFKSVAPDNSEQGRAINRCVPKAQNSRQSILLNNFYCSYAPYKGAGLGGGPGSFKIAFEHADDIKYCQSGNSLDCTNNGNEWMLNPDTKEEELAKYHEPTLDLPPGEKGISKLVVDAPHEHFLTKKGRKLYIPGGANIGDVVHSPVSSSHSKRSPQDEDEFFEGDECAGDKVAFTMDVDEIVALANATAIDT